MNLQNKATVFGVTTFLVTSILLNLIFNVSELLSVFISLPPSLAIGFLCIKGTQPKSEYINLTLQLIGLDLITFVVVIVVLELLGIVYM